MRALIMTTSFNAFADLELAAEVSPFLLWRPPYHCLRCPTLLLVRQHMFKFPNLGYRVFGLYDQDDEYARYMEIPFSLSSKDSQLEPEIYRRVLQL